MNNTERREFEAKKEQAVKELNALYKPTTNIKENSDNIQKVKPKETFGLDFLRSFNFKNISLDNDRLIILILILLLSTETQNELLILALVYILL